MILNFKKKEFLVAGLIGVLNLAILAVGGWVVTLKIIESSARLKQQQDYLRTIQDSWRISQGGQSELNKVSDELEKIKNSFVSSDNPVEFINQIESLAQKTSSSLAINLTTLGGGGSDKKKDAAGAEKSDLSIQITTSGSFVNFMHFLRYLENMKYLVRIDSFSIGAARAGAAEGDVAGIINLTAFSRQ